MEAYERKPPEAGGGDGMKKCAENFNRFCPDYQEKCRFCGAFREPTNADRIRSMSDEELAKLLLDGCRGSKCDDQPQNEWGSVNCFQCRLDWLQQPAEEADHDS